MAAVVRSLAWRVAAVAAVGVAVFALAGGGLLSAPSQPAGEPHAGATAATTSSPPSLR